MDTGTTPGDLRAALEARSGPHGLVGLARLEALRPLLLKADSFLARDAGDLPDLTLLAHADPEGRLNAAAVKEERG